MAAFMFLGIVVGGLLIGLVIITGFTKQLGEHWAEIITNVITILFLIFAGLGLWLPLSGRLPGTREHE